MHYTEMTDSELAQYSEWCATQAPVPFADEDEYIDMDGWGEDR